MEGSPVPQSPVRSIIGAREGKGSGATFRAVNPATDQTLDEEFLPASVEDVDLALRLASNAFSHYRQTSGKQRASFLRKIAVKIESLANEVIERAHLETALPRTRLQGETARTCGQLRLFAQLVDEGSWVDARIDRADPDRKPAPKPDIRSMLQPLGPVGVFGASNFPLAFSVAGGDTASALAAGNPVVVKAHPAHPGTSRLVGNAIRDVVKECALPEGVFSLLFDNATEIGAALVKHPLLRAVGFTGSRAAGRALMDLAASRPMPIPFFGEMSSTNPVFILPGALRERSEAIATGLHASFTLGAGQFCTKPGLVFYSESDGAQPFREKLRELVRGSSPFHLLTSGIRTSFNSGIASRKQRDATTRMTESAGKASDAAPFVGAVLFETEARRFLLDPHLSREIFGPATLLVHHSSRDELLAIAHGLEGHLTATVLGTDSDLREYADLLAVLEEKVGRLIFNGFPTGVEVTHAMVHGGPYPATSDGRSTSVGSQAIFRFVRPICYQGFPNASLPDELKDANPLGIWRMVDGAISRDAILPHFTTKAG